MIRVFLISLMLFWTQSPNSSLTLVVRDEADRPVVGLTVTVVDSDPAPRLVTTDSTGHATFAGLHGSSITLTAATTAAGQPLALDPTTPRDGMVLGLIPHATRTVLLRLDDGLLFLDPLDVFAGTDQSAGAAPTPAGIPLAAVSTPGSIAVPDRTADLPDNVATPSALLWCIGVLLGFLICLTALLIITRRRR